MTTLNFCQGAERLTPNIALNEPEFRCVPNQPFKEDCNNCFCDASGRLARCTLMACPHKRKREVSPKLTAITFADDSNSIKVYSEEDIRDENFSCQPETDFKVECNTCWCASNGKPGYCTRIACRPNKYPQSK